MFCYRDGLVVQHNTFNLLCNFFGLIFQLKWRVCGFNTAAYSYVALGNVLTHMFACCHKLGSVTESDIKVSGEINQLRKKYPDQLLDDSKD